MVAANRNIRVIAIGGRNVVSSATRMLHNFSKAVHASGAYKRCRGKLREERRVMALKMILTGDVNLMNVTDPKVPFARVGDELRKADVVFSNLECCLVVPPNGHSE